MTLYSIEDRGEYPFYTIEIEVTDLELLEKLDKIIKDTIQEHYYGDTE